MIEVFSCIKRNKKKWVTGAVTKKTRNIRGKFAEKTKLTFRASARAIVPSSPTLLFHKISTWTVLFT